MELIEKAIVLNSIDYGDADKLVSLFCENEGKITAKIRGVRKAKAKLAMATQPMYFGEFELIKKGDLYQIINSSPIDTNFDKISDYDVFVVCAKMLKIIQTATYSGVCGGDILANILRALQYIDATNRYVIFVKFVLELMSSIGYDIQFDTCGNCGKSSDNMHLDAVSGLMLCDNCSSVPPSKLDYKILKLISTTEYDKLHTLNLKQYNLMGIANNLVSFTNCRLNSNIEHFV